MNMSAKALSYPPFHLQESQESIIASLIHKNIQLKKTIHKLTTALKQIQGMDGVQAASQMVAHATGDDEGYDEAEIAAQFITSSNNIRHQSGKFTEMNQNQKYDDTEPNLRPPDDARDRYSNGASSQLTFAQMKDQMDLAKTIDLAKLLLTNKR